MRYSKKQRLLVGWREWVSLPELGIASIKAKIDSGARTSCLHAYFIEPFHQGDQLMVRFGVHPIQRNVQIQRHCVAPVIDQRMVSDSGGHREQRYVIQTPVCIGDRGWKIELTLTDRDTMLFRMLIGRTAMRRRLLIDPGRSFVTGKDFAYRK